MIMVKWNTNNLAFNLSFHAASKLNKCLQQGLASAFCKGSVSRYLIQALWSKQPLLHLIGTAGKQQLRPIHGHLPVKLEMPFGAYIAWKMHRDFLYECLFLEFITTPSDHLCLHYYDFKINLLSVRSNPPHAIPQHCLNSP